MRFINKIKSLFSKKNKPQQQMCTSTRFSLAQHEAAHGIVWYLFRDYWNVHQLTIERENLPEKNMYGALHISPNFDVNREVNIERANELFAIALAGMIGQNMSLILRNQNLVRDLMLISHFNQILDTNECGGDFEIAHTFLQDLGQVFQVSIGSFTKYKVLDLVSMFQDHVRVQQIHELLTSLLIHRGTLDREELIFFFESEKFQDYIELTNLDVIFFHQR